MKLMRAMKIVFVIAISVMLAGCLNASYYFSFADEQSASNAEGEWLLQGEGLTGFNDFGIYVNGVCLTSPLEFAGDFSVTANFWLGATAEYPGYVEFVLSDLPFDGLPGNWLDIEFLDLATENEMLRITDSDGTELFTHADAVGEIKPLNKGHWNKLEINKKGNRITLSVNSRRLSAFDLVYCSADYLYLNIISESNSIEDPTDPSLGFILKDVKVEYMEGQAATL